MEEQIELFDKRTSDFDKDKMIEVQDGKIAKL